MKVFTLNPHIAAEPAAATRGAPAPYLTPFVCTLRSFAVSYGIPAALPGAPLRAFAGRIECAGFENGHIAARAFGCNSARELVEQGQGHVFVATGETGGTHELWSRDAVKLMAFVRRRPGLEAADFIERWRGRHQDLLSRLPGLQGFAQHLADPEAYGGAARPLCDGIAEFWWPDIATLRRAWMSPEMRAAADDAEDFARSGPFLFVARESRFVQV